MIAIQLNGGLGNQLFQYATARAHALKQNELPYLDLSLLKEQNAANKFHLDSFKIKADYNLSYWQRWWFHNVTKKKLNRFTEESYKENLIPRENVYLKGYWQNRSYFHDIREKLIAEIRPVSEFSSSILSRIKKTESVAVHIRRGDYTGNDLHEVCTPLYFMNAMNFIRSQIPAPLFFIFSDDIGYCKEQIKNSDDIIFVEEKDIIASFWLMKNCRHFVLSNSSYSWWAQYLSREQNIITAPPHWFNDSRINTRGIYFSHWKIIETV